MEFDEETALNYLLKYELIKRDAEDENRFCIYPLDEAIARLHAGRYAQIVEIKNIFLTFRLDVKMVYSKTDINDSVNSIYRRRRLTYD